MRTTLGVALLMVSTVGCVGGSAANGASSGSGDAARGAPAKDATGTIDEALVGSWYAGRGGTSIGYDTTTGTFGAPNGTGMLYAFHEDGTYQKAVQSTEDGPCLLGYVTVESGVTSVVEPGKIALHPSKGVMNEYSCSTTPGPDKPVATHEDTLAWTLAPYSVDPSIDGLTLVDANGASAEFRRTK